MNLSLRIRSSARTTVLLLCAAGALAPAALALQDGATRFVRAGAAGAQLRNFPDLQGLVVRDAPAGALMQVHSEEVGFLRVAIAGGVKIWVYGEFLEPTSEAGVLRCVTDGVNMRPRASSAVSSLPLPHKLRRGDLLRMISRNDPAVPLAKDWIELWSPSDAHAFVVAADTLLVADTAAAEKEWAKTATPIRISAPAAKPRTIEAAGEVEGAAGDGEDIAGAPIADSEDLGAAVKEADELFASAKDEEASFADAAAAYRRVLELAPAGSPTAKYADRRLIESNLNHDVVRLQAEIDATRAEELRIVREAQALRDSERERRELLSTTHWGRFNARGWIEKQTIGKERHYYLNWGGELIAEIASTSGRFDLDVFQDCEVGVIGDDLRAAIEASATQGPMPRVIDVYRIEVLSVRAD